MGVGLAILVTVVASAPPDPLGLFQYGQRDLQHFLAQKLHLLNYNLMKLI